MTESVENKTTRLIVSDLESESSVSTPSAGPSRFSIRLDDSNEIDAVPTLKPEAPTFAPIGGVDFSDRSHAEAVIKDLPMDEFLRVVEGASPEELQSLLRCADMPAMAKRSIANPFGMLFDPLEYKSTGVFDILAWWESRRFFYNVIVGTCGLFTIGVEGFFQANAIGWLFLLAIPVAIMANICYTAGSICDAFARRFWREKAEYFGPILFSIGLIFSMMIVLSPIVVMSVLTPSLF